MGEGTMTHKHRVPALEFFISQILDGNAWQYDAAAQITSTAPLRLAIRTNAAAAIVTLVEIIAAGDDITATGYYGSSVSGGTPAALSNKNEYYDSKEPETVVLLAPTVVTYGKQVGLRTAYGSNQTPQREIRLADVSTGNIYMLQPYTDHIFELATPGTASASFSLTLTEGSYMLE